jgi:hypothetical protein
VALFQTVLPQWSDRVAPVIPSGGSEEASAFSTRFRGLIVIGCSQRRECLTPAWVVAFSRWFSPAS